MKYGYAETSCLKNMKTCCTYCKLQRFYLNMKKNQYLDISSYYASTQEYVETMSSLGKDHITVGLF